MFQALLFNRGGQAKASAAPLCAPADFGLAETEHAAEAQVALASVASEQVLCHPTLWRSEQGGVDAGDVLHLVHPLEVGACVETQLGAEEPAR